MDFWMTAGIVFLLCTFINLPYFVMELREDKQKKQGKSAEQPRSAEPRLQEEKQIQEKEPVENTPAAEEKAVQSQGAVALYNAMYAMHQYEWGHEIKKDPKLVQRLNQIHHNLTYGDIPEVDCPTVIRMLKKNDGHALNWTTVYFTDYHYDDNGILRKIETTGPDYRKIPANEALTNVQVFDENGSILRHCPAFVDFSKSSFSQIPPVLAIHSGAIRNGQYGYERYELTMENIYSDTFEPKPFEKDGWENYWSTHVPFAGEKRTLDYWYGRTDFPEAPGYEDWSFKILKCSPKFEDRLMEQFSTGKCGDNMTWRKEGDVLYFEGTGELKADWEKWCEIQDGFPYGIQKVVIRPGCNAIGRDVFGRGCESITENWTNLVSVEIPETVTTIGDCAFWCCDELQSIRLPSGLVEIGVAAFEWCRSLTTLVIPDSVTEIGKDAFKDVPLIIYNGPAQSDDNWGALRWEKKPESQREEEKNPQSPVVGECGDEMGWRQLGDTLYIEEEGVMEEVDFRFDGSICEVVIAPGCTEIPNGTFYSCENLQTVELPEGLLRIGEDAFRGCPNLREINLPEGLREIGADAFSSCENLKLQIPDSVTEIGERAFLCVPEIRYRGPARSEDDWGADQWADKVVQGTCESGTWTIRDNTLYIHINGELPLRKFSEPSWYPGVDETVIRSPWYPYEGRFAHAVIAPGCTKIRTESFRFSHIQTISIPGTVTEIESHAFEQCHNLQSVVLPEGITEIESVMFFLCKNLTSVVIPDGVKRIGSSAFHGCSNLRAVTLPKGLTVIEGSAFNGCEQFTSAEIPEGVTEIGKAAFKNCSQLAAITIPASVTKIGARAFEGLSGEADIQVDERNSCFANIDGMLIDQVRGILLTCRREKTGRCVIPDGITEIGDCAFAHKQNITEIVIPEGVTKIGFRAFHGCSGLSSLEIPGSAAIIEENAFWNCTGLTSVRLWEGIREIEGGAFHGCTAMARVEIPKSVTKIGGCAFERCDSLVSVWIPSGVTKLQSTAFGGLSGLKEIQVDEKNGCFTSLDGVLFDKNLHKLISFPGGKTDRYVIPDGVTRIGSYAFGACHRLKSVTIPDSVTTIESSAFANCSGLETLIVPDSVTDIWSSAFYGVPHIIYNGPAQSDDNWGALSRN